MKKLFTILSFAILIFSIAGAQVVPVLSTTITKGYQSFKIDGKKYPLNSVIVWVNPNDTSMVSIILRTDNWALGKSNVLIASKKRVKYINGTTGASFPSITAMKNYCDTFLYSH